MANPPPPYPGDDYSFPDKSQPPPGAYQPLSAYAGQEQSGAGLVHTAVVQQPGPVLVQVLQDSSVRVQCPHCRAEVMTATEFESGNLTWLSCVLVCILGCNLGCCLIPFMVDGCKDVVHTCPNCHQQIGRYNRM